MKLILFRIAIVVAVFVSIYLLILAFIPPPSKYLIFTNIQLAPSNSISHRYAITVSNASNAHLLCGYLGGGAYPWFEVAYLESGVWKKTDVRSPGGASGFMSPREVTTGIVTVPANATKFKIGLSITRLTWRGRMSWYLSTSRFGGQCASLTRILMGADLKTRTLIEWSDECQVLSNMTTNSALIDKQNRL